VSLVALLLVGGIWLYGTSTPRAVTSAVVQREEPPVQIANPQTKEVTPDDMTATQRGQKLTANLGLTLADTPNGPVISNVDANSQAADVGLRSGDRIVTIDGKAVGSAIDVPVALSQARDDALISVYHRNGEPWMAMVRVPKNWPQH
jgi:S1-C subfamily serine protease